MLIVTGPRERDERDASAWHPLEPKRLEAIEAGQAIRRDGAWPA